MKQVVPLKPEASITLFLELARRFVREHGVIIVPRASTERFMRASDMTPLDLETLILALRPCDCFDGPEPDRDPLRSEHWTVAVLRTPWEGRALYLKVSVSTRARRCTCLSVKPYETTRSTHGFELL